MSWCCENLRDCKAWKDEGLQITATNNEAAKLYDASLRQLVSWLDCNQLGGIVSTTEQMLEAEPDSIIGRSLSLGMDALSTNRKLDDLFASKLDTLVKDAEAKGNEREKKHARAVRFFANGQMTKACNEWEAILRDHPTDLQAIKFSHDAYFFFGKPNEKLASIEAVIKEWSPGLPCASYLHGMHAFALEEKGMYDQAEISAKKALEMQKHDAWATHAFAHCKEMNGQFEEGIKFMESTRSDWMPCWMIACHNFWHTALFYLEKADFNTVLDIYDSEIAKRSTSKAMLDLVDAASLLTRLEMEGVEVGKERWNQLVPLVEDHIDSHTLAFNDAHISMIVINAEDEQMKERHSESIRNFISSASKENEQRKIMELYSQRISDSIDDLKKKNFSEAFESLYQIRNDIIKIGGSNAQRDVFTQLLVNAGLQSNKSEHKNLAVKVMEERNKLKKNSLIPERVLQRHKAVVH